MPMKQTAWFSRKFQAITDPGLFLPILERLEGTPFRIKCKLQNQTEEINRPNPLQWSLKKELGHLIDQYGGCCHCSTDQPITIDHVIPMSQPGGSNRIDNIQPLCEACHREKEHIYLTTGVLMDYRKVLS